MTKTEFLLQIPGVIEHQAWGYGELEIVSDNEQDKGVCYRHPHSNSASYGTYGRTWKEVYDSLHKHLIEMGHIKIASR